VTEKIDLYDILSNLILGVLAVCWAAVCFPVLKTAGSLPFPEGFATIALAALALFVGQLIQALASLVEPVLTWTFGGRTSDVALAKGLGKRYLPADTAARIREKLVAAVGRPTSVNHSLFLFAMQRANAASCSRCERFNGLFAYHRGLFVLMLLGIVLLLCSVRSGAAATWPPSLRSSLVWVTLSLLLLVWYRTKQRAMYYVREVLLTAERALDEAPTNATKGKAD